MCVSLCYAFCELRKNINYARNGFELGETPEGYDWWDEVDNGNQPTIPQSDQFFLHLAKNYPNKSSMVMMALGKKPVNENT